VTKLFVNQTFKKPSKSELFVNVFAWNKVPAPENDETPIPVYGLEAEVFKIYTVVNIVFSPQVLDKYGKSAGKPYETDLLVQLAFNYIEDQNKAIAIDRASHYEILQNVTCKGDVNKCIEKLSLKMGGNGAGVGSGPSMSDLEMAKEALGSVTGSQLPDNILNKLMGMDLDQTSNTTTTTTGNKLENSDKVKLGVEKETIDNKKHPVLIQEIPSYESKIVGVSESDDGSRFCFDLRVSLPNIKSIGECELEVDGEAVTLIANREFYGELVVPLGHLRATYDLDVDGVAAKFVKKTSVLRVKIPMRVK
jgi:hypothetical protein